MAAAARAGQAAGGFDAWLTDEDRTTLTPAEKCAPRTLLAAAHGRQPGISPQPLSDAQRETDEPHLGWHGSCFGMRVVVRRSEKDGRD